MTDEAKAPATPPNKIARLASGEELQFPHDYPDSMMDQDVRRHMGVPEPIDPQEALAYQQLESVQALRQTMEISTRHSQMLASSVMEAVQAMQATSQNVSHAVQALGFIAKGLDSAVSEMSSCMSRMTASMSEEDGGEKAVAALREKLDTLLETVERGLRAEKRIVTDDKGRPIGVRVVEN